MLQSLYIKTMNPIFGLISGIDEKKRRLVQYACIFVIVAYTTVIRSGYLNPPILVLNAVSPVIKDLSITGVLILFAIFSIKEKLHYVTWKKAVIVPIVLMGISTIAISFIHPVGDGYRLMGFQLLLVFPCVFFVWNNRGDYSTLFRVVSFALTSLGLLTLAINFVFALRGDPLIAEGRFKGIMMNSNCFSLIGMDMVAGGIYLLITVRMKKWIYVYIMCSIGFGIGMMVTGQMRIAIMVIALCIPVTVFFFFKYVFKGLPDHKTLITGTIVGALIIAATVLITYGVMIIDNNKIQESMAVEENQAAADTELSNISDRFKYPQEGGMNAYSSNRLMLWKNYADKLNMSGNDFDKYDRIEMTGYPDRPYAHNMFLEVGYRFGIPIGLLFVLYLVICGLISIRYLFFNKKKESFLIFPVIWTIVFAFESMIDCAVLPFFQIEAFIYYLSAAVFIDSRY